MVWVVLLSDTDLSTRALTPVINYCVFGVCQDLIGGEALASYQQLYLTIVVKTRLHLNAFRGVRAISKFDQPFTPTLNSSKSFATLTGSVLQLVLPNLQPDQGQITWFRVYHYRLSALLRLAFASAAGLKPLTLPVTVTRRFIMQKARRHSIVLLRPLVSTWFQVLFHSSISKYFSPFPHGTCSLSVSREYLALPDGPG